MRHDRLLSAAATAGLLATVSTGCGRVDPSDKPTGARPPAVVDLDAAITAREVLISRIRVGPGAVRVIVVNQTTKPVRPRLLRVGGRPRVATLRRPIGPGSVGTITADVTTGRWRLQVDDRRSASLRVSGTRPDAGSRLLEP